MDIERYMDFGISSKNLMEHLTKICQWERLSGTAEELEAFQYVEKKLKSIGAATTLLFHDAYISLPGEAKLTIGGRPVNCHTASMAKSTSPDGIEGMLVYAPACYDLTERLCYGKIVLIGATEFESIHRAWKCGALGVIGCAGEYFHEKIISNAWGSPTPESRDLIPDVPYVSVLEKDFATIREIVERGSPTNACMKTIVHTGWTKIPLLIADVKAEKKTDQYVMFSGHMDSWYYGATDNGTANAVQMEITRIALKHRHLLERNLKVVFYSGHSHGRYAGSAWHADNYWQDLHDNCIINVNADIIGGSGATDVTRSIIMPEARDAAVQFIKEHTGIDFIGGRCGRNGDQSYYIMGISSAFSSFSKQPRPEKPENKLSQTRSGAFDFGWWWHTDEDLIDKVDPEFFLRDAKIFTSFIMYFLMSEVVPLNFLETALELRKLIGLWAEKTADRFDLTLSLHLAEELIQRCIAFYTLKPKDLGRFNEVVMGLSRILVPLNYTTGNPYENDSGIPLPPIPSLRKIEDLLGVPCGSSDEKDILVALTHGRNFVNNSFTRAIRLVEKYMEGN